MASSEPLPTVNPGAAEGEEETILYDLLVNTEWPPETEVQPRGNRKHGASFIITKAIRGEYSLFWLPLYPAPFLLPDGLVRLVNKQINWHLVLASNGKLLAAVQDQCVEISTSFFILVPKDPKPQWRRVAWSYDCTLLAYAESMGTVRVFDLMGSELFVITPASSLAGDLSYAIAGLIFLEYKASAQWSAELLVINYRGELRSYLVSVGTHQSYQESHCFSFSSHYPHGINTAIYHPGHRLLLVGGCETAEVGISKAASCGLSAWRVLSGSPYYKPVTHGGDRVTAVPKTLGLLRMLSGKFYSRQGQEQDGIFKMSLSPGGTLLAAIHFSGKLSIWAIPSLKQQGEWTQHEQPGYDDLNPDWRLSTEKRKKIKDKESFYPLIDVNWWVDSAVILARCSGALTVSSVKTLKNLLGKSCEWFEPSPQVTATHDGGFLSLECEIKLAPKRSRLETRAGEDDEEEDSDSDQEISAKTRYFGYIKQGLYLVTEMERFAPPRKRPRTITKNYRLVSLRSTTPEELYQRKIESEEYEEALSLAQTYGLDTDLVYQRQWRKSAVNIASIQNYLSKIKKRSWVLHECLERVPENVDAAKELLQYGLKGTDLEALLAIGKGADDGRFTLPGEMDIDNISYEELSPPEEEPAEKKKEKELKKRRELLKLVNFSKLTLEQKELCRCRLKLLTYLDRLATYEHDSAREHPRDPVPQPLWPRTPTPPGPVRCLREPGLCATVEQVLHWPRIQHFTRETDCTNSSVCQHRPWARGQAGMVGAHLPRLQQKIIPDQDQLMALALCYDILECLPQRGYGQKTEVTTALHDMVDQLEHILSVSEILEKHGLEKPISYVKNTQSSSEEARKLMVRLTRHTGRKQPPVSESHWRVLLQDMLTMQQNVYTCLDSDACYEIFTESLLCSSRLENIHLAGQMMHCSACSISPPNSIAHKGKTQFRVSYEKSIDLVLAASREYFNSSTNLTDTCMDLARCCLQLITDRPAAIQEELDLIQALGCLEEFGVKILPLQVRLCSDRIGLVKECICQSPMCYKQSTKLLDLAELLRVAGEDPEERRGQVLILLVEQALRFHDYKAANVHCQELMATGYSKSWDVCSQLAQSEGYQDLATRQELMAFALTHCPPSSIELLLAASSSLKTEILYQRVNFQIHPEGGESINMSPLMSKALQEDEVSVPGSNSADLLHWTTATTMKVLSNTTTTTKAVLQAVSDGQWWKKSLTYLRPLQGQEFGGVYQIGTRANEGLEKQGCHPFYESVISNPFVVESEVTYDTYQHIPVESFAEVLLRTGKLAETKTEGEEVFPTTEVLLQLASDALPNDMTLALAYLLALPQVLDANKCFEKQSHSALSLQLAAYYYSLQIYAQLAPCFRDKCHPLYRADPKELIKMVSRHVTLYGHEAWPEELAALTKQLHYYNERLLDFTQAQILQGLRKGVDVQRFTADDQYKRETILGLAETLEENVYSIALSLAQRYSVSRWEVFMTHLEFLFTDSGLSTGEIENRAQSLHLFETLKTDPEGFHKHMVKYIYPTIGGFDHERLLYYFTLLESCGSADFGKYAIKPETHVRLLKKFKVVASGLDYKKLTDENMNPLEALEPILSSQNILSISKLVPKIPGKDGRMLSPSSLYTIWLQKLFWTGDPHLVKQVPASPQEWLHAYDVCMKYFDRLLPGDLITVVDAVTFSPKAVTKLSLEARKEMTGKAIKAVRHFIEKPRKRNLEEDTEEAGGSQVTYADALNHLEQSLAHLETLNHSFIISLKNSEQEMLQKYGYLYDLSRSEKEKVYNQAVAMCLDGQPLRMIQQLLEVAVGPLDISPKDIVQSAVTEIVSALSGGSADLGGPADPLHILEGVVAAVHASVDEGEELVSSEDLLEWLRPFCANDAWPVRPRIHVLQILGQSFHLTEEDGKLLVFFRTEAILKATWPQRQVDVSDVADEEKRCELFTELLEASHREVEFQHLVLLLQAWPPMKREYTVTNNPWVRLATVMLTRCTTENKEGLGNEVLKLCRSLYNTEQMLPAEGVKELCSLLLGQALLLPSLKLLLESPDERLHTMALDHITAIAKVNDSNCDQELLSLLLDAKLLVKCLSTPFYPRLIKHLLASPQHGRWDPEELARQLWEAGHEAEAGSLLLAARGTHRALRTFSTALGAAQHWV
uniref:NBAS subunit of NRZ tethering complex n=1 Tax=Bos taurus TaxID=9913 RepID=A0A3Q1MF39_BOVIN